ncbi:MAG: hypothetical protein ACOH1T_01720 [Microbacteriaceae bacterium]
MNTTLSRPRHESPPRIEEQVELRPVTRVSLLDRVALHLGLALITWSRRTRVMHDTAARERRAHRYELRMALLERERAAERTLRLTVPRR